MKKTLILLNLIFISSATLFSQSISRELVSGSGDFYSNSNGMLSWSVGEPLSETYTSSSNIITQGFHQTKIEVLAVDESMGSIDVTVYPNPTHDNINLSFTGNHPGYEVKLYDFRGKIVEEISIGRSVSNKLIDISGEATGTYMLHIIGTDQKAKNTYKIQKLNY